MHHGDRGVRQAQAGIQRLDARIVPALDLAHENVGQHFAVEVHVAHHQSRHVHDRHHAAHDHGELHQPGLVQLGRLERSVGSTEVDGLRLDLLDAATRTDGLIVERHTGLLVIGVGPLRVHRIREGRTRTVNLHDLGVCRSHEAGAEQGRAHNQALAETLKHVVHLDRIKYVKPERASPLEPG